MTWFLYFVSLIIAAFAIVVTALFWSLLAFSNGALSKHDFGEEHGFVPTVKSVFEVDHKMKNCFEQIPLTIFPLMLLQKCRL